MNMAATRMLMGDAAKYLGIILRLMIRTFGAITAFLRGNSELSTTCDFVRVEPFVVPKKSLTGESTERVDTRVLQVLYAFERNALPVYVGQQMDVFIEAPPVGSSSAVNLAQIKGAE